MFQKLPSPLVQAKQIIEDVCLVIKLYNQKALIGKQNEDLELASNRLYEDYLQPDCEKALPYIRQALQQFKNLAKLKADIEFGDFFRICNTLHTRHQQEERSKNLMDSLYCGTRTPEVAKNALDEIKNILKKQGIAVNKSKN